jgi:hypothetical protein
MKKMQQEPGMLFRFTKIPGGGEICAEYRGKLLPCSDHPPPHHYSSREQRTVRDRDRGCSAVLGMGDLSTVHIYMCVQLGKGVDE